MKNSSNKISKAETKTNKARETVREREKGKQCLGDWQKVFQAAEQVKHNNKQATASPGHAERGKYPAKSACKVCRVQNILNDFSAAVVLIPFLSLQIG